jgi:hypothetical protein
MGTVTTPGYVIQSLVTPHTAIAGGPVTSDENVKVLSAEHRGPQPAAPAQADNDQTCAENDQTGPGMDQPEPGAEHTNSGQLQSD